MHAAPLLCERKLRGYCRIEVADVQEAWFLLATFEREMITKTSEEGVRTLNGIAARLRGVRRDS